ncbi:MAG: AsnC family transcriptional regulator [Burkholderiales bacterium]
MFETLDATDRLIVNQLQEGFPICERPFEEAARPLGIGEQELIERLRRLRQSGVLSRFGPLYQAERAGGALALVAMKVPPADLEWVVGILNALPEVAHNYLREHEFNVWFVLAAESEALLESAATQIHTQTGYPVMVMPKLKEYFLDLRLAV